MFFIQFYPLDVIIFVDIDVDVVAVAVAYNFVILRYNLHLNMYIG